MELDLYAVLWDIIWQFHRIFAKIYSLPFSCSLSERKLVPVAATKPQKVFRGVLNFNFVSHIFYCFVGSVCLKTGLGNAGNESVQALLQWLAFPYFFVISGCHLGLSFTWQWRMAELLAAVNSLSDIQRSVPGLNN